MENPRSGQSVHYRMMKREDNRGAIEPRQHRCSHQRPRKSTERQTELPLDHVAPICGCFGRHHVELDRVVGATERRSRLCIIHDADPQRRMPLSNLLKCCSKPGEIQYAFDLGGKTEMHRKGQRIEIEEALATPQWADKDRLVSHRRVDSGWPAPRKRSIVHCHHRFQQPWQMTSLRSTAE